MAEAGHEAGNVFIDQNGNFNLNGAAFYNDADADISAQLEAPIGSSAAGIVFRCGSSANSTTGINTPVHGLSAVVSGFAHVVSTAASISSTVAGQPSLITVKISGSTFQFCSYMHTSTSDPTLILATSSAHNVAWGVFGTV